MEIDTRWTMLGVCNRLTHHADSSDCVLDCPICLLHKGNKQARRLEIIAGDDSTVIDQPRGNGVV